MAERDVLVHTAKDVIPHPLYVVTTVFNPIRYKTRWKWYQYFSKYVVESGAKLITVEAAFGDREFVLKRLAPDGDGHRYVQVTTDSELWVKENMTDIGISHLPRDAKYVGWVDADVTFARQGEGWVHETLHQLQHYQVVQMFSDAVDLGPLYIPLAWHKSFMWCYHHNVPLPTGFEPGEGGSGYYQPAPTGSRTGPKTPGGPNMWHPGFAWAARRDTLDKLGGLIDFAILGAGDNHMARGLIGKIEDSIHPKIHPRYREKLLEWQAKADRHVDRNVGYVSGLLIHYWHGRKVQRGYWRRWSILTEQAYNPDTDILFDSQGLMKLVDGGTERQRVLRDRIMRYFRSRNEDSIDLEGVGQDEWTL
jgi:hypothetical protein